MPKINRTHLQVNIAEFLMYTYVIKLDTSCAIKIGENLDDFGLYASLVQTVFFLNIHQLTEGKNVTYQIDNVFLRS